MTHTTHEVLIVGAGAGGLTVAAQLRRRAPHVAVALVDPAELHYYQPGFTTVGGGAYAFDKTVRHTKDLIPTGAQWIQARVASFQPEKNQLTLENGDTHEYKWLIAAPGIVNDWNKVEGLSDTLGKNGVCSNYSPDTVRYTWELIDQFKSGRALFTQPPLPFKCPGAPQKIAYLAADRWRQRGIKADMHFFTAGPTIFGVPEFAAALDKVVQRYGIQAHYTTNLVALDGAKRVATFEITKGDVKERVTYEYDLIHVTPPQSPPTCVKQSTLANAAGFIEVNQSTMRHVRFDNVFGLGDACSTPNSKSAAAVRKQAPVVVQNLLAAMRSEQLNAVYDGYGSCPLTTSLSTVMLAEFIYGGKITPTFPLNPFVERRLWWYGKIIGFPWLYWQMVKGFDFDIAHSVEKAKPFMPQKAPGT